MNGFLEGAGSLAWDAINGVAWLFTSDVPELMLSLSLLLGALSVVVISLVLAGTQVPGTPSDAHGPDASGAARGAPARGGRGEADGQRGHHAQLGWTGGSTGLPRWSSSCRASSSG